MIPLRASGWPDMPQIVPEGQQGTAAVQHFTIDPMRSAVSLFQYGARAPAPGTYARLNIDGSLWMSDTPAEAADHCYALHRAQGEVLIGGLGLGMIAIACAAKPEVRRVTVLELNPDVIALVAPAIEAHAEGKLHVIQADALTWKPEKGVRYDCIWWDIWRDLNADDLPEHSTLNRRAARGLTPDGWYGCWGHKLLIRRRGVEQAEARERDRWRRAWR